MARNTTTRTRGQEVKRSQSGDKYHCLWCPKDSTHGQAIISHINGTHLKDENKAAVQRWFATNTREERMRQLIMPRSQRAKGPGTETVSTPGAKVAAVIPSVTGSQTNYWEMGRAQVSSDIAELEQNIAEASTQIQQLQNLISSARTSLEAKRRELQIAEQLINRQIVPNGSEPTTGSAEQPRAMHA